MYKGSSNTLSLIKRVASHSTRGSGNGDVPVLPISAILDDPQYLAGKEQFTILLGQIDVLKDRIHQIDRMPLVIRRRYVREKGILSDNIGALSQKIGSLCLKLNEISKESYARAFYAIASMTMDSESFHKLDRMAAQSVGHTFITFAHRKKDVEHLVDMANRLGVVDHVTDKIEQPTKPRVRVQSGRNPIP